MSERIDAIDAVRGFALAGILVVNSMAFASTWYATGLPSSDASPLDRLIEGAVSALFELKFYLLFSFLFGYSVTLQMQSAERAGTSFLPRMMRRQAGLFAIGALHAVFLFHGDILSTYAVLGLILLALRRRSDRFLIVLAVVLIAATALLWAGLAVWQAGLPSLDQTDMAREMILANAETWRSTAADIVAAHVRALEDFLPLLLLLQAPTALAMFLLGYVAGRREVFAHLEAFRQNWSRRVMQLGLFVGLPGAIAYAAGATLAPGTYFETAGLALSIVTAPLLSAAMVLGFLHVVLRPAASGPYALLTASGRMALTNYLMQSLLLALVFHGYGLGLINRLSLTQVLLVNVVIIGLQLVLSKVWLSHFRYGPLEWLLRAVTRLYFRSSDRMH